MTITNVIPRVPAEAIPSAEQFEQLQQFVLLKYPALIPSDGLSDEYHRQFVRAFRWLLVIDRLESPRVDTGRYLDHWLDRARAYNRNDRISPRPFLAAAIACADVTIFSDFSNLPWDCSLGLRDCDRSGGVDRAAGWKRILSTGQLSLLPVAPPPVPRQANISFR